MKPFYMPIVNRLKVGCILLTDLINNCYDPFDLPPHYDPVANPTAFERLFYADLHARFMQPSGEFLYQLPRPADAGDTALFQGLCTGMEILKGRDVTRQIEFINTLFIQGALIRGYTAQGTPNDTTSNDAATGMVFFFYCALFYGDEDTRAKAGALLMLWVNSLRAHDWSLVDLKGNPTQYGALDNGVLTDPLRITLLLAILSLAMAYDQRINIEYADVYEKYRDLLAYPKVKLLWWDTDYDTHRAAIHLHVLYAMTRDERYKEGLQRIWKISEKTQNAWVYVLCSPALDRPDAGFVRQILSTFDFDRRQQGNVESLNPDAPSVMWPPKLPFGVTEPKERAKHVLPFYKRGSQEFFWQRNMLSKDEWVGNKSAGVYHTGLDFLVCAWLANRIGLFQ